MKVKYLLTLLVLITLLFNRCEESERGQYPIDSLPPNEVILINVENIPGGAILSYRIPEDDDLLYVKALYKLDDGSETEQKVSSYSNEIKIVGLGRSHEVEVKLIAVDRSRNESKPLVVKTFPLDSPIHSTFESLVVADDFGGIRLNWTNYTGSDMVVCVNTPNEKGELVSARNFYTNSRIGSGNVRGYESAERFFEIYVRDIWGNHSDTLKGVFKPLFEEELKEGIKRWNPSGIPYKAYLETYSIEKMWDGNINTRYLVQTGGFPYSFTFDLGKKLKFSRITQVQMQNASLYYTSQNIQYFQLWGTNTPNEVTDSFDGWIKLGDFEIIKPSGLPLGQTTPEDRDLAVKGHELNVDPEAPAVRYIRYVIVRTWSGDQNSTIAELRFFGSIQE